MKSVKQAFDLTSRVAVITGGTGLLGFKHAEAIAEMGGVPVLFDLDLEKTKACAKELEKKYHVPAMGLAVDISQEMQISSALKKIISTFKRIDILVNNAANNPKVESKDHSKFQGSRLENFPLEIWNQDIAVGLTGAFLCSRIIGTEMARRGKGVILNIASDLALIGPDQRIYRRPGSPENEQPVKPVSYSVVKSGLLGLTRYLATYWADRGVCVNALCPGGVYDQQDEGFVKRLSELIPLGHMASQDEYKAAIVFLVSDASSYMTGSLLTIDGGRTCW
ncbi:MAG: SDR family oxidoreductase [Chlamydiae bacterium]|nr:SDR family oxidoreductase [Chlamydiota bacterium]MBI3276236.1 SDR family oxidoreductase [Chlamydiota bacterium]